MNKQNNQTVTSLQQTIDFVWDNPLCSMYTDYWRSCGISEKPTITSVSDYESIPTITKDFLADQKHLDNRLFTATDNFENIIASSGSSGKPPLYSWRPGFHQDRLFMRMKKQDATTTMILFNPSRVGAFIIAAHSVGLPLILGDSHQMQSTARLLIQSHVDSLVCTPSIALLLAPYLEEKNYINSIKHICLTAEKCSSLVLESLKQHYLQATFGHELGMSELGCSAAFRTPQCNQGEYLHEDETNVYIEELQGEMTVTSLRVPGPSPMVRYRTGDAIKCIHDVSCECGRTGQMIRLLGRHNVDFIRIGGVEIRASVLEEIILSLSRYIHPTFQCVVHEQMTETGPRYCLEIFVRPISGSLEHDYLRHLVTEQIMSMSVSATSSLSNLISRNVFDRPIITINNHLSSETKNGTIRMASTSDTV